MIKNQIVCDCGKLAIVEEWAGQWAQYRCSACYKVTELLRGLPIAPPERVDDLRGALLWLSQAEGPDDWEHALARAREVLAK